MGDQHRGPQEGGGLRSPRRAQFAEGTEAPSGPGSALTAAWLASVEARRGLLGPQFPDREWNPPEPRALPAQGPQLPLGHRTAGGKSSGIERFAGAGRAAS